MKKVVAAIFVVLFVSGCAPMPTQEQIDHLDYGKSISQADAEQKVKSFFVSRLKDPSSAMYDFSYVHQGYMVSSLIEGRKLTAGYIMDFSLNAKNSYGGYTGSKSYRVIFINGYINSIYSVSQDMVIREY